MSEPHPASAHRTAHDVRPGTTSPGSGRRPSDGRPPGPDPDRLAEALTRLWLEVRTGRRALHQLAPLLSPAARRRLAGQLPPHGPRPSLEPARVRVGRSIGSSPAPGVREVSVMVDQAGRTTSVAVRVERHRGAWRAVELTPPEAGLAPLPTASLPEGPRCRDAFDEVLEEHGELDTQVLEGPIGPPRRHPGPARPHPARSPHAEPTSPPVAAAAHPPVTDPASPPAIGPANPPAIDPTSAPIAELPSPAAHDRVDPHPLEERPAS